MTYRTFSETEIVEHSRTLIHAFMTRQIIPFRELLDEGFVWIGDYASQYIQGRDAFMENVSDEVKLPPLELSQEEYSILTHERYTWISYGRCVATMQTADDSLLASGIHFTFVWKQKKDRLYLMLASANHVQDEQQQPGSATPATTTAQSSTPQARVFDRISPKLLLRKNTPKINIRDSDGNLHFLFPDEIVYARSNDKYCTIYTLSTALYSYMRLKDLEQPGFSRIHKQYVVNLSYLDSIRRYKAKLTNGIVLPIGKARFGAVQEQINDI